MRKQIYRWLTLMVGVVSACGLAPRAMACTCGWMYTGWVQTAKCKCDLQDTKLCQNDGEDSPVYTCSGTCPKLYRCVMGGGTMTIYGRTRRRPNCVDVGYWPIGPKCDEDEDCQIEGYTVEWGYLTLPFCGCICVVC